MSLSVAKSARPSAQKGPTKLFPIFLKPSGRPPPDNVDRLSKLPPELLEMIFDQVSLEGPKMAAKMKRGLSKSLLPFTDKCLYRHVRLGSLAAFRLFIDTTRRQTNDQKSPSAYLVEHFEVSFKYVLYLKFKTEVLGPFGRATYFLTNHLPTVRDVSVAESMPLSATLLLPDFAENSFPNMEKLKIGLLIPDGLDSPMPLDYGALNRYPRLQQVAIELHHLDEEPHDSQWIAWNSFFTPSISAEIPRDSTFTSITALNIDRCYTVAPQVVANLIAEFPSAQSCNFKSLEFEFLPEVLGACSPSLMQLSITPFGDNYLLSDESVNLICNFKCLTKIAFGYYSEPTEANLQQILGRESGPPQLREMVLNILGKATGEIGQNLRKIYFEDEKTLGEAKLEEYGWKTPDWSDSFEFETVERAYIFEKATNDGIVISGTFFESLKVQLAYDDMLEYVQRGGEGVLRPSEREREALKLYWERWFNGELGRTRSSV